MGGQDTQKNKELENIRIKKKKQGGISRNADIA